MGPLSVLTGFYLFIYLRNEFSTIKYTTNALPKIHYQNLSVQVLEIIGRHRLLNNLVADEPLEFMTIHKCFDSPERVLQDNVSLYKVHNSQIYGRFLIKSSFLSSSSSCAAIP